MKSLKIGDLLARIPIIQGGMGVGVSLSGLASAVANEGRLEHGYAFCGANAWRSNKIQSVRELISSLCDEFESFKARFEK